MKHTKGKWFVKKSPSPEHSIGATGSLMPVASIGLEKTYHYSVMVSGEKRDLRIARCFSRVGDANLIASAPAMLEMLKSLRKEIGDTIIGRTAGWNKKVDELIAKAEGSE